MTMTIEDFGAALIKSGDLDPVYIAVHKAGLDEETRHRLCLAYWCLYHLGAASKLAEIKSPKKFWDTLMAAAVNEGLAWPRGSERRHFRAANAINAVGCLVQRYKTPRAAVLGMLGQNEGTLGDGMTFATVAKAVQTHVGFGPWIAFKIADMSERVLGWPTDFTGCELGVYKDPRQGGALAWYERALAAGTVAGTFKAQPWNYPITNQELTEVISHYVRHFRKFKAPPTGDRAVNVQEVETIFCKYKSHRKGHYPLGKDTRETRHGLDGWGDLAQQLRAGLPAVTEQRQLF